MSESERLDFLEKTLGRILAAIGAADAKVAQLFAISTGMLGFEATIVAKVHFFFMFNLPLSSAVCATSTVLLVLPIHGYVPTVRRA